MDAEGLKEGIGFIPIKEGIGCVLMDGLYHVEYEGWNVAMKQQNRFVNGNKRTIDGIV